MSHEGDEKQNAFLRKRDTEDSATSTSASENQSPVTRKSHLESSSSSVAPLLSPNIGIDSVFSTETDQDIIIENETNTTTWLVILAVVTVSSLYAGFGFLVGNVSTFKLL